MSAFEAHQSVYNIDITRLRQRCSGTPWSIIVNHVLDNTYFNQLGKQVRGLKQLLVNVIIELAISIIIDKPQYCA